MSSRFGLIGALSIAAMLPASVSAQADSFKGCYGAKYTTLEVLEISEDHSLVIFNAYGTGYVLDDPSSPFNGMSGPCVGAAEIKGDAVVGELWKCVRSDKDGDKIMASGESETLDNGTWAIEGLTGKYVGVKGTGHWRYIANDAERYHACFDMTWTRE